MFCTTTISCVVFHNHKHQNIVIRILTIVISVGCAVWRCASRTGMSNCSPAMMMSLHRFDRFDVYLCDTDVKDPIAASPHGLPWDESRVEQLWRTAGSCWTGEYYHWWDHFRRIWWWGQKRKMRLTSSFDRKVTVTDKLITCCCPKPIYTSIRVLNEDNNNDNQDDNGGFDDDHEGKWGYLAQTNNLLAELIFSWVYNCLTSTCYFHTISYFGTFSWFIFFCFNFHKLSKIPRWLNPRQVLFPSMLTGTRPFPVWLAFWCVVCWLNLLLHGRNNRINQITVIGDLNQYFEGWSSSATKERRSQQSPSRATG